MATLEEAAIAFTQRFVADVAAGGAQMTWQAPPVRFARAPSSLRSSMRSR